MAQITAPQVSGGDLEAVKASLNDALRTLTTAINSAAELSPVALVKIADDQPRILFGNGVPEAVVDSPLGSVFVRLDAAAGARLYVKEGGGNGNTGWVAK